MAPISTMNLAIHPAGSSGILYAAFNDTSNLLHEVSSPANLLVAGTWQHVALTYDRSSGLAAFYLNGSAVTLTNLGSFIPQTGFTNLLLGARTTLAPASQSAQFSGAMDEPSLYNRALSSNEVAAIYLAGSAGKCTPPPVTSGGVPVISSFSPTSGSNGTVVVISGTNFSATAASNIVYFGIRDGPSLLRQSGQPHRGRSLRGPVRAHHRDRWRFDGLFRPVF